MLLAVERGMLHEFKGKRLCDIDIKGIHLI